VTSAVGSGVGGAFGPSGGTGDRVLLEFHAGQRADDAEIGPSVVDIAPMQTKIPPCSRCFKTPRVANESCLDISTTLTACSPLLLPDQESLGRDSYDGSSGFIAVASGTASSLNAAATASPVTAGWVGGRELLQTHDGADQADQEALPHDAGNDTPAADSNQGWLGDMISALQQHSGVPMTTAGIADATAAAATLLAPVADAVSAIAGPDGSPSVMAVVAEPVVATTDASMSQRQPQQPHHLSSSGGFRSSSSSKPYYNPLKGPIHPKVLSKLPKAGAAPVADHEGVTAALPASFSCPRQFFASEGLPLPAGLETTYYPATATTTMHDEYSAFSLIPDTPEQVRRNVIGCFLAYILLTNFRVFRCWCCCALFACVCSASSH
jgi:hypothetical protein